MNIAFITKDYNTGTVDAGFTSILNLAKELKKRGHFVVMISNRGGYIHSDEPYASKKYEVFQDIPIYRPYVLKWFKWKTQLLNPTIFFNRFIASVLGVNYVQKKLNIKFDVIHSSSSAPYLFLSSIIAKRFYCRNARLFHTIRSESNYFFRFFKTSRLLNRAEEVIVPLKSLKKKLMEDGCSPEKIKLINSAIDLQKFRKIIKKPEQLKKEYKIEKDEKVVLYYGKGGYYKGVEVLLDAINYFPENEKVKFLFFHPVIWLPHQKELVKNHKYREKIVLSVKRINVPDFLKLADIQVLPFRSIRGTEGNPLCLLEGMAAGTPIVTTELDDLKEIVAKDKDVLMAKPGDAESLAKKIILLLNDASLRNKLVSNAYEKAKKFDIASTAEKHLELYSKALKK